MNYAEDNSLLRTNIDGSRSLNNIFWAVAVSLGGLGFFLSGLTSFLKINLLRFANLDEITFIPQGIALLFYGTVGTILGLFLLLTIWWDFGVGYNEFNKSSSTITIYRKGFPGKNKELFFTFNFDEVKSIKMRIKEGLNPKRQLLLCLNDKREIPLTGIEEPRALNQVENEAITLAKYLNVLLETE